MPSINDHSPQRAVLYARVSTQEQATKGYSLAQQMEALREYAACEGYEVLEKVIDSGQSGASLERPGMDLVRDLVAAGGVSVVLAQDRDRFAREPAYHYLLRQEFEEHGCKIRALNDHGGDSPESELTDGILDQLAKFERAKTAERTRRGKLKKAREGKIIAGRLPDYGFEYNETRDNYIVDEETMSVVRRIFYMIGVEGSSINAVRATLDREGVPTATGKGRGWATQVIRRCIMDDAYKPHTFEEVAELISAEVASKLEPEKHYGIWWFNVRRTTSKQVVEVDSYGRRGYRRRTSTASKPREEWIAVPVPDGGIPREWVDTARERIKDNPPPATGGGRFYELSSGIFRCGGCGRRMLAYSTRSGRKRHLYHYYLCPTRRQYGKNSCPVGTHRRAEKTEAYVWEAVREALTNPEQLRVDLERMIDLEREGMRGDPEQEAKAWVDALAKADRKRSAYQDQQAEGLITLDELSAKLAALEATRKTARRELEALERRRRHLEELERDKDTLLESYTKMTPEALYSLTPEERHELYKMLRLKVQALPDSTAEVSGVLGVAQLFVADEPTSRC